VNLQHLFYRLPVRFDADRLAREAAALPPELWNRNYRDLAGTFVLPLIAAEDGQEAVEAPLRAEEHLMALPYVSQVVGSLGALPGRARLVRVEPGGGYPPRAETTPYWQRRIEVHVPIVTNPQMRFFCARQPVHMPAGEAWICNNAVMHRFVNDTRSVCIHLIVDLTPDAEFWRSAAPPDLPFEARFVGYREDGAPSLEIESCRPAPPQPRPTFDRPVFIVAAPRSGSTLLFETLAAADALWTLGGEGGAQVESIAPLAPQSHGLDSNRIGAAALTPSIAAQLLANYTADLRSADRKPWRDNTGPHEIRFLEKTPKNALRIPFFKALFPDARFIFLHREAKANISAIIEAWQSGKFITYSNLPGWRGSAWSLLLIPGWRELSGAPLGRIAMRQWRDTNAMILDDLSALPAADWCAVSYDDLVRDPAATAARLCAFAQIEMGPRLMETVGKPLRLSSYTLSQPDPEKWRRNEAAFAPYLGEAQPLMDRLSSL
jgi:hypothetical protein